MWSRLFVSLSRRGMSHRDSDGDSSRKHLSRKPCACLERPHRRGKFIAIIHFCNRLSGLNSGSIRCTIRPEQRFDDFCAHARLFHFDEALLH